MSQVPPSKEYKVYSHYLSTPWTRAQYQYIQYQHFLYNDTTWSASGKYKKCIRINKYNSVLIIVILLKVLKYLIWRFHCISTITIIRNFSTVYLNSILYSLNNKTVIFKLYINCVSSLSILGCNDSMIRIQCFMYTVPHSPHLRENVLFVEKVGENM